MKFKDLVEGKIYKYELYAEGTQFKKIDSLLCVKWIDSEEFIAAPLTFANIKNTEFEEVPEYVTFEEAIEYMMCVGKAKIDHEALNKNLIYSFDKYNQLINGLGTHEDPYHDANFFVEMLEPKWILL